MKKLFSFKTRKKIYDWYWHTRYSYSEIKQPGHLYKWLPQDALFQIRKKKNWFDILPDSPANKLDNFFAKLIQ